MTDPASLAPPGRLILQRRLPVLPWMDPMSARLPGVQPCPPAQWLLRDEAFDGQMAYRDDLIATQRGEVVQAPPGAGAAARLLLEAVLAHVARDPGYRFSGGRVTRPDGVEIDTEAGAEGEDALALAGRLVQEDLVLLSPFEGAHRLVAAVVCFPASWTLRQKMDRPMIDIHGPVARYDASIARRTERILAGLRIGEPVWRGNVLPYNDPELRQPRAEGQHRTFDPALPTFIRVERQTLLRLSPDVVAFAIHTAVVRLADVPAEAVDALRATPFWAVQR